jgi:hypothetical protein
MRFPRLRATLPPGPVPPTPTAASARPGGREAPAMGGSGACRRLWAPGGPRNSVVLWQGRWPLPWQRRTCFRRCGRDREAQCVSPPVRDGCPEIGRSGCHGRPAPAKGGAGLDRCRMAGAMAPARTGGARTGRSASCLPVRLPMQSAPLQHPFRPGADCCSGDSRRAISSGFLHPLIDRSPCRAPSLSC